mmetsp:Transcript_19478/g.42343  ORF Transcript_19478/g.42343 Transcript_19478/m.42343 type:complete len:247 (-) Transcript_19478:67-807(-)
MRRLQQSQPSPGLGHVRQRRGVPLRRQQRQRVGPSSRRGRTFAVPSQRAASRGVRHGVRGADAGASVVPLEVGGTPSVDEDAETGHRGGHLAQSSSARGSHAADQVAVGEANRVPEGGVQVVLHGLHQPRRCQRGSLRYGFRSAEHGEAGGAIMVKWFLRGGSAGVRRARVRPSVQVRHGPTGVQHGLRGVQQRTRRRSCRTCVAVGAVSEDGLPGLLELRQLGNDVGDRLVDVARVLAGGGSELL